MDDPHAGGDDALTDEEARLPTHLWVMAEVRRCNDRGVPAMLRRRGERMGGLLLVKINTLDGRAWLYVQQRDLDGRLGWMAVPSGEPIADDEAEAYVERSLRRDPDLWVVEVEDRQGRNPFPGPRF